MKVIVFGAGVIGVTTAYYLARQGAEVLVLDRQRESGMETSYANAGEPAVPGELTHAALIRYAEDASATMPR